jgi:hypothetical protein
MFHPIPLYDAQLGRVRLLVSRWQRNNQGRGLCPRLPCRTPRLRISSKKPSWTRKKWYAFSIDGHTPRRSYCPHPNSKLISQTPKEKHETGRERSGCIAIVQLLNPFYHLTAVFSTTLRGRYACQAKRRLLHSYRSMDWMSSRNLCKEDT